MAFKDLNKFTFKTTYLRATLHSTKSDSVRTNIGLAGSHRFTLFLQIPDL